MLPRFRWCIATETAHRRCVARRLVFCTRVRACVCACVCHACVRYRTPCFIPSNRRSSTTVQRLQRPGTGRGCARSLPSCVGSAQSCVARRCCVRTLCSSACLRCCLQVLITAEKRSEEKREATHCTIWVIETVFVAVAGSGTDDPWDIAHAHGLARLVRASECTV
jgi:hypothetical protein